MNATTATVAACLRNPKQVATVIPSSGRLTHCISQRSCISRARSVIELGAGVGNTTTALLQAMPTSSKLLAIEMTDDFMPALEAIEDQRLRVEHGDALSLRDIAEKYHLNKADAIVSGIPFSTIPQSQCLELMQTISEMLTPCGKFIAYQFSKSIKNYASQFLKPINEHRVWWNFPPLVVYEFGRKG